MARDYADRPIAGALVEVVSGASIPSSIPWEPTYALVGRDGAAPVAARTDAEGLEVLPHVSLPVVAVSAPGRERKVLSLRRFDDQTRIDEFVVRLGPRHELSGTVVDRAGRPVPGAVVVVAPWHRPLPVGIERLLPQATCDDEGRFRVDAVGAGTRTIYVSLRGRPLLRCVVARVPGVRRVVIELPATGAVEGTVVERGSDAPIAGARVWFAPQALYTAQIGVETDEHGRFRVDGVQVGAFWSDWADAAGHVPARRTQPGELLVPTDGVLRVDYVLDRGARVCGRVTCEGAPVAGAAIFVSVKIAEFNERQKLRAVTDERGDWRVDGVGVGTAVVGVTAPGMFQPAELGSRRRFIPGRGADREAFSVPGSGEVVKDVELLRGTPETPPIPTPSMAQIRIRGVVVGPGGRPPREARVRIALWTDITRHNLASMEMNADETPVRPDGSFEDERSVWTRQSLKGLVVWAESVDRPGPRSRVVRLPLGDSTHEVRLLMRGPWILRGRVTSAGAPVADARVCLLHHRDRPGFQVHATADDDGRFAVPARRPGRHTVEVQARGFCSAFVEVDRVRGDEIDVELAPAGEIGGRLVWPDGAPCVGAVVKGKSADSCVTGVDGRFLLRGLPLGESVALEVDRPRLSRLDFPAGFSQPIRVGTPDVELRLPQGRTLVGRVVDEADAPASDVHVLVWSAHRDDRFGIRFDTTDADGRFLVNGLPEPPWSVETYRDHGDDDGSPRPGVRVTHPHSFADDAPAEIVFPLPATPRPSEPL